jgi:hypothetical protein
MQNSTLDWTLTIIDDGSEFATQTLLNSFAAKYDRIAVVRLVKPVRVLGKLKNLGVWWSAQHWGRGDFLYVADNDGCFTPDWDGKLTCALALHEPALKLIGPYRHPYHHPNLTLPLGKDHVASTDAVQGIGHLMRWPTWDKYGPMVSNAPGTNQSEDYAFCRKMVDDGFLVGSIQPDVVYNCGLTDTQGRPCVGIETMKRIQGVTML